LLAWLTIGRQSDANASTTPSSVTPTSSSQPDQHSTVLLHAIKVVQNYRDTQLEAVVTETERYETTSG
jgi:hypothetical protein